MSNDEFLSEEEKQLLAQHDEAPTGPDEQPDRTAVDEQPPVDNPAPEFTSGDKTVERPKRRARKTAEAKPSEPETEQPSAESVDRGPFTPAQFSGDGWDDMPVQMRGTE